MKIYLTWLEMFTDKTLQLYSCYVESSSLTSFLTLQHIIWCLPESKYRWPTEMHRYREQNDNILNNVHNSTKHTTKV